MSHFGLGSSVSCFLCSCMHRLLPELSSALLCFTGEISGDVRILSRDGGGAP